MVRVSAHLSSVIGLVMLVRLEELRRSLGLVGRRVLMALRCYLECERLGDYVSSVMGSSGSRLLLLSSHGALLDIVVHHHQRMLLFQKTTAPTLVATRRVR
jgi:hypothetical protein